MPTNNHTVSKTYVEIGTKTGMLRVGEKYVYLTCAANQPSVDAPFMDRVSHGMHSHPVPVPEGEKLWARSDFDDVNLTFTEI